MIFSDDFETGLVNWDVSSDTEPPDPGYGWQIADAAFVSPTHSAFVKEDSSHQNWMTNHYLTLAQPLDLSLEGNYFLTFLHRYQLDRGFKLWVEASADDGTTWDPLGKYGSHETSAAYSTGDFVYEVLDLSSYAGAGNLLIRFHFDSMAGSGSYGDWFLDDVNVFHSLVPKKVALLSPAGGEVIPAASTYVIEWEAPPKAETFKLLYSADKGTTWKLIEAGVRGNSYCWHVPRTGANKKGCLVKVIGYDGSGKKVGNDISNSPFTIEVVRLTSPNGGPPALKSGDTTSIMWTIYDTAKPITRVQLSYTRDGGTTWTPINPPPAGPFPPGDYSHPWWVPSVGSTRKNCKVKVVLKDIGGVVRGSDVSDTTFTITP
jgi:hypothetical protein